MRLAQQLLDPAPPGNCKLQTQRQYFRLPERGAHTALGDVLTVADLFGQVLRPIAERYELIAKDPEIFERVIEKQTAQLEKEIDKLRDEAERLGAKSTNLLGRQCWSDCPRRKSRDLCSTGARPFHTALFEEGGWIRFFALLQSRGPTLQLFRNASKCGACLRCAMGGQSCTFSNIFFLTLAFLSVTPLLASFFDRVRLDRLGTIRLNADWLSARPMRPEVPRSGVSALSAISLRRISPPPGQRG